MSRIFVALYCVFLLPIKVVLSQDSGSNDSLSVNLDLGAITSSKEFLPFYIINNQYGELEEDTRFYLLGDFAYSSKIGKHLSFDANLTFRNDIFSQYSVGLNYQKFYLRVGRFKEVIGGLKESPSSGSLGISKNALPIPQISLGISDYINVPFTHGYFKTKGFLSHGWFENERVISKALYHGKAFYLMLDLDRVIGVKVSSGVVHFAQFGGVSPQGDRQPSSFKDYLRVFVGSGIPNPDGTTAGESNAIGNHLGIIETTIEKKIGAHVLRLNYQKPFEDRGGLQYISLTDYLIGIEIDLAQGSSFIDKFYLEYSQTKWQGGPGLPDPAGDIQTVEDNFGYDFGQRDDIYNNWLYRNGWTYHGMTLGSPLILTHSRTLNFFEDYPDYGVAIGNNRIKALHFGVEGSFGHALDYRLMFTYSRNFGTYSGLYGGRFKWDGARIDPDFEYPFRPGQNQYYSLLTLDHDSLFKKLPINAYLKLAFDFGDLYNLFGSEIGLSYRLK